jgi:hypothetical protein
LTGDCTHILGNCSGVFGDLDSIPKRWMPDWKRIDDYTVNV